MGTPENTDSDAVHKTISAFVEHARYEARDGLTIAEFSELVMLFLHQLVETLDGIQADGKLKKAWAMQATGLLFDAVASSCVPVAALPAWFVTRSVARAVCVAAASGVIEFLVQLQRKTQ